MNSRHRVLIVDDHKITLAGLKSELSEFESLQVIGEVGNGRDVLPEIERLRPNVVVLDLSMDDLSGTEIVSAVKKEFPEMKIVVHTVHTSHQVVHDCLIRGAEAYVAKNDSLADVGTAVRSVIEGKGFLSPEICLPLAEHYRSMANAVSRSPVTPLDGLSTRERDVIRLSAHGLKAREIAKRLKLAPKTVDNYRFRIRQKLGLPSLAALVSYAIEHGLAEAAEP